MAHKCAVERDSNHVINIKCPGASQLVKAECQIHGGAHTSRRCGRDRARHARGKSSGTPTLLARATART